MRFFYCVALVCGLIALALSLPPASTFPGAVDSGTWLICTVVALTLAWLIGPKVDAIYKGRAGKQPVSQPGTQPPA